jgi:hypothetical protein
VPPSQQLLLLGNETNGVNSSAAGFNNTLDKPCAVYTLDLSVDSGFAGIFNAPADVVAAADSANATDGSGGGRRLHFTTDALHRARHGVTSFFHTAPGAATPQLQRYYHSSRYFAESGVSAADLDSRALYGARKARRTQAVYTQVLRLGLDLEQDEARRLGQINETEYENIFGWQDSTVAADSRLRRLTSDTSGPVISSPVTCLNYSQTLIWQLNGAYPVYVVCVVDESRNVSLGGFVCRKTRS